MLLQFSAIFSDFEEHFLHYNIAFMGKSVSIYVVSTNVAGLETTYDVTSRDDCADILILVSYCRKCKLCEKMENINQRFKAS